MTHNNRNLTFIYQYTPTQKRYVNALIMLKAAGTISDVINNAA